MFKTKKKTMYFPSEKNMTLNLDTFEFKNALCRVLLKLAQCSRKEDYYFFRIRFFISVVNDFLYLLSMNLRYFATINPALEKGLVLPLNKLEFPSPRMCFVLSLAGFCPVVLKNRICKWRNFAIISPWKRFWPSIWWILNFVFPKNSSLVKIGPMVLEKKLKMWKVNKSHRRTDRRTTAGDQASLLELIWHFEKWLAEIKMKCTLVLKTLVSLWESKIII